MDAFPFRRSSCASLALVLLGGLAALPSRAEEPLQATSLLGRELRASAATAEQAAAIAAAEEVARAAPHDVEIAIALGRAQAAVWRYRDAIDVYTRALEHHPDHAMLYRHRGHRYLSVRDLDAGLRDMERAAQLEQGDFDIWYHLGLARYLKRDFGGAAEAYRRCRQTVVDDESIVAVTYWHFQALSRAGDEKGAAAVLEPIRDGMTIEENRAYYDMLRHYKGLATEQEALPQDAEALELATRGYGLANWKLLRGDRAGARAILERIVAGEFWPAFGFLASEVELVGMR
jgi:tetratricopeptide (TPR) repeat protein